MIKTVNWQSICSREIVHRASFQLFLKPPLVDNMLTGMFSSTMRSVIGSEFVRKKLSIALLF